MKKSEKKTIYTVMAIIAIIGILLFSLPNGTITIGNKKEIVTIHLQDEPDETEEQASDAG